MFLKVVHLSYAPVTVYIGLVEVYSQHWVIHHLIFIPVIVQYIDAVNTNGMSERRIDYLFTVVNQPLRVRMNQIRILISRI